MSNDRPSKVLEISKEWLNETFLLKNKDYGSSYILAGQTLNLWFPEGIVVNSTLKHVFIGLMTRMLDKMIRASNLVLRDKEERIKDEKAYQTLGDLAVYCFMASEVIKNNVEDK